MVKKISSKKVFGQKLGEIIFGSKICWVNKIFVKQNFRPLGPLFLVEVEFLVGWWWGGGMNSNNRVKPNLRLRLR